MAHPQVTPEQRTPCESCKGEGSIMVPTIVRETHYGVTQTFAKMESFDCYDCKGLGYQRSTR